MLTENTHLGAETVGGIMKNCRGVFFIGVGGINMSSLAHLTHLAGYRTAGSDRTRSALTERLEGEGIRIFYRHDAANITGCDVIVYTVAISDDNPEYLAARAAGLPCISRADYLGYIMTGYAGRVGISGTHGKSTCTSMCASVFMSAGADPTVLSGAVLPAMGGAYRVGGREHFIFEACEYRDSFLDLNPTVAVVLNIEPDHLDYFSGIGQIKDSFTAFVNRPGCEHCVINADDAAAREVMSRAAVPAVTFGLYSADADFRAVNVTPGGKGYAFDILIHGGHLCHIGLSVPGLHNVYNALAAAAAARLRGISPADIKRGLESFTGASRRMEYRGLFNGAPVYDDYAHHPTEIRATLKGAADICRGRLICVFQPHTYNRTAALFGDFAAALRLADRVIVADIYAARASGDNCGVSAELLARAVGESAEYVGGFNDIAARLGGLVCPEDTLVIMGAGDISRLPAMLGL